MFTNIIQGLVMRVFIMEARNLLVTGRGLVSPIFLHGIGSVSVTPSEYTPAE